MSKASLEPKSSSEPKVNLESKASPEPKASSSLDEANASLDKVISNPDMGIDLALE